MTVERSRMEWGGLVLSILMVVSIVGIALGSLTSDKSDPPTSDRPVARAAHVVPGPAGQLAAVDRALARKDLSVAVFAWRDAYSAALGTRRWDAMVEVGDAAMRIHELAGSPPGSALGHKAEARQAYLRALFLARSAGSQEGIDRVAKAFAALGDAEMAARAQSITVTR